MRHALGVVLLFLAGAAHAELIEVGLYQESDALLTLDMDTGLEWLDISETLLITHNDIRANSTGLLDLGFRVANRSEVQSLFSGVGIVEGPPRTVANAVGALELIDKIGCGFCEGPGAQLIGVTAFFHDEEIEQQGEFAKATYSLGIISDTGFATTFNSNFTATEADTVMVNRGTFLVRDSLPQVPIPAAVWLFGSALGGLGRMRRKKTV